MISTNSANSEAYCAASFVCMEGCRALAGRGRQADVAGDAATGLEFYLCFVGIIVLKDDRGLVRGRADVYLGEQ